MNNLVITDKTYGYGKNSRIGGIIEIKDTTNGKMTWKEWKRFEDGYSDRDDVIEMLSNYLISQRKKK